MNVMIDIETLGSAPGSVILSIGAQRFDAYGPLGPGFYRAIDPLSSLMAGFTTDAATCQWWSKQEAYAVGKLYEDQMLVKDALEHAAAYIYANENSAGPVRVWAKPPQFDLVILGAAYDKMGMRRPWAHRNERDLRTMLRMFPGVAQPERKFEHYALADAQYQVTQLTNILKAKELTLS